MDDQKSIEDTDQQKKVTFDEKDDRAPTSQDNKAQEDHEEQEEEGRRSRASRSSRSNSADAFRMESDEEKLKRAQKDGTITNKSDEEKNNTEKSNNDMNDGLGDDIEILQNTYKQEENKEKIRNETKEDNENKNEINKVEKEENADKDEIRIPENISDEEKAESTSNNKHVDKEENAGNDKIRTPENISDEEKAESTSNTKHVEFDKVSNSSRYSLNSRRSKNEETYANEESTNKPSDTKPQTTPKYEMRSSISSLDSDGGGLNENKTAKTRTMSLEEDKNKQQAEPNKSTAPDKEEQKSDDVKDTTDNTMDVKQLQHEGETKDEYKERRDDLQYHKDDEDDNVHAFTPKAEKEKETKVTIKVLETKPQQKAAETKKVTASPYHRKQTVGSSKPPVSSSLHQSYPRPTQRESLSPREIVADQRKERRQMSQSARYPSQGKSSSSRDVTMTTRASSRASTIRSSRPPSRARTSLGFSTERRRKEKEFFHAELQRLKDSLRKESKKIKKPKVRDHYPDVFTSLEPYYNTYSANFLINMPDLGYKVIQPTEVKKQEETEETRGLPLTTKNTSIGLCDPEESLSMDRNVLPKLETAETRRRRIEQMHARESKPKSGRASSNTDRSGKTGGPTNNDHDSQSPRQKRPEAKQGSTRLPKFPVIAPPSGELSTKELHYGDVPMLRDEMIKSFSHFGDDRKKSDYNRTRQDFYRMELDRLDEYHETTRPHMRRAYFAYLQNTPGSRKAIYDCMKEVTSPKKKEEQSPQAVA